jgi:hypothetical protein
MMRNETGVVSAGCRVVGKGMRGCENEITRPSENGGRRDSRDTFSSFCLLWAHHITPVHYMLS